MKRYFAFLRVYSTVALDKALARSFTVRTLETLSRMTLK